MPKLHGTNPRNRADIRQRQQAYYRADAVIAKRERRRTVTKREDEDEPEFVGPEPTKKLPVAGVYQATVTLRGSDGRLAPTPTAEELDAVIAQAVQVRVGGRLAVSVSVIRTDR